MKRLVLILLALLMVGSVFAQTKFTLKIVCNVMEADVYINNKLYTKTTPNLAIQLPIGTYSVKIAKAGYVEFNANVTIPVGGTTLNATLNLLSGPALTPAPTIITRTAVLTVMANVPGADVYLSGKLMGKTPFSQNVMIGQYDVVVRAAGYSDFTQRIQLQNPVTVNAVLQPLGFSLSVNSNVSGADVFINGNPAGKTPFASTLPGGSYTVVVKAAGYLDFTQNVLVSGPVQVNAMLQPMNAQLSVSTPGITGAIVFINGAQSGQTPYSAMLPPGVYTVTVRMPGYADWSSQVNLNGAQNLQATLMPLMATWQFILPTTVGNQGQGQGQGNEKIIVQLWIDGQLMKGSSGQVMAGKHTVRIGYGNLYSETVLDMQTGKNYSFELFLGLNVK